MCFAFICKARILLKDDTLDIHAFVMNNNNNNNIKNNNNNNNNNKSALLKDKNILKLWFPLKLFVRERWNLTWWLILKQKYSLIIISNKFKFKSGEISWRVEKSGFLWSISANEIMYAVHSQRYALSGNKSFVNFWILLILDHHCVYTIKQYQKVYLWNN